MSYVMLGDHRIDCPEEYLKALGLVNGQSVDQENLKDMSNMVVAAFDTSMQAIRKRYNCLSDSHDELLAAAKMFLEKQDRFRRGRLQAAIEKAEKISQ